MKLYPTTYNPTASFKKEMSNVELYGIEAIINEMHKDEEFFATAEGLGLSYTSSGDYAMYNICNGDYEHEGANLSYFAITEDGRLWTVAYDEEENEVFFVIEN
ncbi:hypothetical protein TSARBOMBA_6 [Bacillus phage TsarBomba]|nr:hypothetical protein TSARBOMBA_6 [Bacillus phage TsarBomba]ALA13122.1 hypothetical protein TSARBOMBA_6 [Bacillus phage TsarBomba]